MLPFKPADVQSQQKVGFSDFGFGFQNVQAPNPSAQNVMDFNNAGWQPFASSAQGDSNKKKVEKYSAFDLMEQASTVPEVYQQAPPQIVSRGNMIDLLDEPSPLQPVPAKIHTQPQAHNRDDPQLHRTPQARPGLTPPIERVGDRSFSATDLNINSQYQQMQKAQAEFMQKQAAKTAQSVELQAEIQESVAICNQLLNDMRLQNEQQLKAADQEIEVLELLNEKYRTLVQKFRDEADDLNTELKHKQELKNQALASISNSVLTLNQQLGINVKTKQEIRKRSSQVIEELTVYTTNIIQDIGKNVVMDKQSKFEEAVLRELKSQRQLIQSLEKQLKVSPRLKIDYKSIAADDQVRLEPTPEQSCSKQAKGAFDLPSQSPIPSDQTPTPIQGSKFDTFEPVEAHQENLVLEHHQPVQLPQQIDFNPSLQNKATFTSEFPSKADFGSTTPLSSTGFPQSFAVSPGLNQGQQQFAQPNPDTVIISQVPSTNFAFSASPNVSPNAQISIPPIAQNTDTTKQQSSQSSPMLPFASGFPSQSTADPMNMQKTVSQGAPADAGFGFGIDDDHEKPQEEVVVHKSPKVQIEFDFSAPAGSGEWKDFDNNFGGFGEPGVQAGFGFEAEAPKTDIKIDDFGDFKW